MLASLVFLTPAGGLAALALVIPLAAVALVTRRERAGRKLLGLASPPPAKQLPRVLALVAIPVLLGIAATQPALRSTAKQRVRTDAQAYFVLDTSRSMLAKKAPGDPTRLAQARKDAIEMRDALPEIPSGIATLTDRVLPSLLPDADPSVFAQTINQAVQIEAPPPASSNIKATSFCQNINDGCSLGNLGTQNFFPATIHNRLAVILTDGESNPVDNALLARQLATGPGIKVIFVHVWQPGEAVYDGNSPEQGYHEDPNSGQILQTLASTLPNGKSFGESSIGSAISAMKADLGTTGPTILQGSVERTRTLAPYVALAALLPLLLIALRPVPRGLASALLLFVQELFAQGLRLARLTRSRLRNEIVNA
jgi:hypothetical protein